MTKSLLDSVHSAKTLKGKRPNVDVCLITKMLKKQRN